MPTEHVSDRLYLIGAGGHAKVVLDALLASGVPAAHIEVRDDSTAPGRTLLGLTVHHPAVPPAPASGAFHVAIGSGAVRRRLSDALAAAGLSPHTVVHPRASVSAAATVGPGTFVAAGAVIAPAAVVGASVIVNHGAVVDHDCTVGDFTHIAPLASLAGGAHVGSDVLVGAGARVLVAQRVGNGAVVGAGAVVTRSVPDGATAVGVPARHVIGER